MNPPSRDPFSEPLDHLIGKVFPERFTFKNSPQGV
jgi:hypothetical protein